MAGLRVEDRSRIAFLREAVGARSSRAASKRESTAECTSRVRTCVRGAPSRSGEIARRPRGQGRSRARRGRSPRGEREADGISHARRARRARAALAARRGAAGHAPPWQSTPRPAPRKAPAAPARRGARRPADSPQVAQPGDERGPPRLRSHRCPRARARRESTGMRARHSPEARHRRRGRRPPSHSDARGLRHAPATHTRVGHTWTWRDWWTEGPGRRRGASGARVVPSEVRVPARLSLNTGRPRRAQ